MNTDPDSSPSDSASPLHDGAHLKHEATLETVSHDGVDPQPDATDSATANTALSEATSRFEPQSDRCRTCGTSIGPREYRISWRQKGGQGTLEAHYCSENCLPDDAPGGHSPDGDEADIGETDTSSKAHRHSPQDWSYCR
ncbi:hypothetical protein G6M89_00375 [Natronolimnobius sp. AArcel1]|uniref:hypothetical protein n=1 Tax=Natronolimnobius sp. AArcel1 TaxID=1679093 RepID=UPI0013EB3114|nr:hypothetical protein [Natronolimnobius sp. AArcel1]NGM67474.1 hypothetical protein [Natronolimnobius sp. AArcel1]